MRCENVKQTTDGTMVHNERVAEKRGHADHEDMLSSDGTSTSGVPHCLHCEGVDLVPPLGHQVQELHQPPYNGSPEARRHSNCSNSI